MKYKKVCPFCEEEFETDNLRRIYCSAKCKSLMRRYRPDKKAVEWHKYNEEHPIECLQCGQLFVKTKENKLYCSAECQRLAHNRKTKEYKQLKRLKEQMVIENTNNFIYPSYISRVNRVIRQCNRYDLINNSLVFNRMFILKALAKEIEEHTLNNTTFNFELCISHYCAMLDAVAKGKTIMETVCFKKKKRYENIFIPK